MTCHYPDLGSASDWSYRVGNLFQPIRSTTQIWVVTRHQYGFFTKKNFLTYFFFKTKEQNTHAREKEKG